MSARLSFGNRNALTKTGSGKEEAMAPQLDILVRGKRISCPGADLLLGVVPNMRKEGGEIRLPDERHVAGLLAVLGYLSRGRLEGVEPHNVAEVLDCARLLGLSAVRDACEDFLVQRLSPANCLELRRLATQRRLPRLTRSCDQLLSASFAEVLAEKAALELPRVQVRLDVSCQLLELGPDLLEKVVPKILLLLDSIRSGRQQRHLDEAVVQLVLQPDLRVTEWTREAWDRIHHHAPLSPERNTPEFYSKLRSGCSPARQLILGPQSKKDDAGGDAKAQGMKLLAAKQLTDAYSVCLVEDRASSLLMLMTVSLCTALHDGKLPASPTTGLPAFSQTSGCFISQMSRARSGFGVITTESEILAIGGFNRSGCLGSVERYSSITNSWKDGERMNTTRGRLCTAQVGDRVFAIGGSDGRRELSSVEVLDLKDSRWRKMTAAMPTPRSCLDATVLGGVVYAVGGEHYSVPLRTVETFDPTSESWNTLPPLSVARSDLAVVACAGRLYAIGGKAQGFKCLSSVEAYDPARDTWSPVAKMKCARRNPAAVAVEGRVMVVGGYSGTTTLRSVEIYDPARDEWSDLPPLCSVRSHAAAMLYNNQVYVLGGYSGSHFLSTVECFDLQTEQWTVFA